MPNLVRSRNFFLNTILAIAFILAGDAVTNAQEISPKYYDFVMEVAPKELKGYLDFPGSAVHPVAKVEVRLHSVAEAKGVHYEDLFVCKKGLLGCRRYKPLTCERKRVAIQLKLPSDSGAAEYNGCAAALTLILVDLLTAENYAGGVYAPDTAFESIKTALLNEGFLPAAQVGTPRTGFVGVQLQSEPPGKYETLVFSGALKDQ